MAVLTQQANGDGSSRMASLKTANRRALVGENVEDGIQFRDLQKVADSLCQIEQL